MSTPAAHLRRALAVEWQGAPVARVCFVMNIAYVDSLLIAWIGCASVNGGIMTLLK
jgi:hypothetical protein